MNVDADILQSAIDAAPAQGTITFKGLHQAGSGGDGTLLIDHGGHTYRFCVNTKTHLHAAMLDRIINDHEGIAPHDRIILVTDQIGNSHADLLIKAGIAFLDMAGNAFIDLPGLYIATTGRRLKNRPKTPSPGRAFQRTGLKLIFAILTDPKLNTDPRNSLLNQMFRHISQNTAVSLGSIGWIFGGLQKDGFIVDDDDGFRLLVDRKNLLQKWCANYIDRIYLRQKVRSYSSGVPDWWRDLAMDSSDCLWGGETAAAKLTGVLKPQIITLYGGKIPNDIVLHADLRPDDDGEVQLRSPFRRPWAHAAYKDCTHPLLVYADLLATDTDRNMEAAQRIYDQYLRHIIEPD